MNEHKYNVEDQTHHVRKIVMHLDYDAVYDLCMEALELLTFMRIKSKDREKGRILAGLDWNIDHVDEHLEINITKLDEKQVEVSVSCEVMKDTKATGQDTNKYAVDVVMAYLQSKDTIFHEEREYDSKDLDDGYAFKIDK